MVELLIAIFVVAVGVLGTISALWYGIRSERYSDRRTQAVYQARELLNLIRSRNLAFLDNNLTLGSAINDGNYDNDADDRTVQKAFNAPPFQNDFTSNQFNFKRHIEMKRLSSSTSDYRYDIVAVKVILFWNEGASEKKVVLWGYTRQ